MPIRQALGAFARRQVQALASGIERRLPPAAARQLRRLGTVARQRVLPVLRPAANVLKDVGDAVRESFAAQIFRPARKALGRAAYRYKLATNQKFYKQHVARSIEKLHRSLDHPGGRIGKLMDRLLMQMHKSYKADPNRFADIVARAYRAEAGLRQRMRLAKEMRASQVHGASIAAGMRDLKALGDIGARAALRRHGIRIVRPEPTFMGRARQLASLGAQGTALAFRSMAPVIAGKARSAVQPMLASMAARIAGKWRSLWQPRRKTTAKPGEKPQQRS